MVIIVTIIIMSIIMTLTSQPLLLPASGLLPLPVDEAIQAKLIILRSAANRSTSQPTSQQARLLPSQPSIQPSTQQAINPAIQHQSSSHCVQTRRGVPIVQNLILETLLPANCSSSLHPNLWFGCTEMRKFTVLTA